MNPSMDLRALRQQPFELLLALERSLREARSDLSGETAWMGLGVRVGDYRCALPRQDVREVISPLPLTRVPGARPWLLGIANLRGSLLPVFDLPAVAGLAPVADSRAARVLVFNSDQLPAGFLVHEVIGPRQFSVAEQRRAHAEADHPFRPWLLGAFEREGESWLALSLHRLTASEHFVRTAV